MDFSLCTHSVAVSITQTERIFLIAPVHLPAARALEGHWRKQPSSPFSPVVNHKDSAEAEEGTSKMLTNEEEPDSNPE